MITKMSLHVPKKYICLYKTYVSIQAIHGSCHASQIQKPFCFSSFDHKV